MTQEVDLGKSTDTLTDEKAYACGNKVTEEEKLVRKALGLPLTKQLVYYKNVHDASSACCVTEFRILEMYDITDRWYTIGLTLEDGPNVRIHSGYLAEMQKASFIADVSAPAE